MVGDEVVWDLVAREEGERTVLLAKGELDLDTAPRLLADIERRLTGGARDIVIDLSALSFIDSTGLGTLVACWRRAERVNARFQLVDPTPDVAMTLEITGLDRILPVAG